MTSLGTSTLLQETVTVASKPPRSRISVRALYERWSAPKTSCPKASRRTRARAVILQSLTGLVLAQIVIAALLGIKGTAWLDPVFHSRLARLQAARKLHPDRPVVIVLGSSRLLNGLDADEAERC